MDRIKSCLKSSEKYLVYIWGLSSCILIGLNLYALKYSSKLELLHANLYAKLSWNIYTVICGAIGFNSKLEVLNRVKVVLLVNLLFRTHISVCDIGIISGTGDTHLILNVLKGAVSYTLCTVPVLLRRLLLAERAEYEEIIHVQQRAPKTRKKTVYFSILTGEILMFLSIFQIQNSVPVFFKYYIPVVSMFRLSSGIDIYRLILSALAIFGSLLGNCQSYAMWGKTRKYIKLLFCAETVYVLLELMNEDIDQFEWSGLLMLATTLSTIFIYYKPIAVPPTPRTPKNYLAINIYVIASTACFVALGLIFSLAGLKRNSSILLFEFFWNIFILGIGGYILAKGFRAWDRLVQFVFFAFITRVLYFAILCIQQIIKEKQVEKAVDSLVANRIIDIKCEQSGCREAE